MNKRKILNRICFVAVTATLISILLFACNGGGSDKKADGADPPAGRLCVPGDTRPCDCGLEKQGNQQCLEDGSGWTDCSCPPGEDETPPDLPEDQAPPPLDEWPDADAPTWDPDDEEPPPLDEWPGEGETPRWSPHDEPQQLDSPF